MNRVAKFFKSTAGMVLIVTILVGIIVHIATGNFFTPYNISTLTRAASFVIIVGFGQTIVLLTGGIDLSVATIGSVCGLFSAMFMVNYGINPYVAILAASAIGIVLGGINGFFIAYFKMTPFIVTLATMQIYQGIVYVITKGMPITGMPQAAETLANGVIGRVLPNIVIIMAVICVVLTIMLKKTKIGRHIYALGGNRSCAKIVGIPTERVEMFVYCLSGLLSAIAGVLMACRLGILPGKHRRKLADGFNYSGCTGRNIDGRRCRKRSRNHYRRASQQRNQHLYYPAACIFLLGDHCDRRCRSDCSIY